MLSSKQAKLLVETQIVGSSVKACVPYKGNFLARVEFPSAEEANYDPFFLVDASTNQVSEFSIMTDGDPDEVAEAFARAE